MSKLRRCLLLLVPLLLCASIAVPFDKTGTGMLYHMFGDPYPRIVYQAMAYVERQYVEPKRAEPAKLLQGAFRALETRFPPVLIDLQANTKTAVVQVGAAKREISTEPATSLTGVANVLNSVLEFVSTSLGPTEKKEDVYYTALNGVAGELDPHSNAITAKQFKEFMIGTQGSFGGIGFVFGIRDGNMAIITPIEGTPAFRAGLRTGDRILAIDGEPTINMPVDIAASKMRGEPDTKVTLTLERDGWTEPRNFTFTREIINVQSVESYVLNGDAKAPVLFVRIKSFQKDTADELRRAIAKAEAENKNLAGVIVDLRNNPGGLLDQAIELSDGFMDKGTIVSTKGRDGDASSRSEAKPGEQFTQKPLVLLINQGSASASEIVSGALRSSRALLIGAKTFGKGSVQKLFPLPDNGALKLTVAQYLTANDISIQSIGIQPDILVYPASAKREALRIGPPPVHSNEADLKNAFTEWGNASEKPWQEVQFHSENGEEAAHAVVDDEDGEDEVKPDKKSFAELSADEKLKKLKEEFPISLARRILERVPAAKRNGADRSVLLAAAEPVLKEVRAEQNAKIAAALSGLNVDWKAGDAPADSALIVRVDENLRVEAGQTGKLSVTVQNAGTGPVYRVWGRSDSEDPIFKGLDFVFGRIDPGKEATWTTDVKAPKSLLSRWDPLKIELHAEGLPVETKTVGGILALSTQKPEFSYEVRLKDKNAKSPELSGNGVIDPEDVIDMELLVKNQGLGTSRATEVNIRAEGGEQIFLQAARQRLANFLPGEKRAAPMSFRFASPGEDGKLTVVVSVTDMDYGVAMTDVLKFDVGAPYAKKADRREPPTLRFSKTPPLRTTADRVEFDVIAEDDESVKELYVYNGTKKILYRRNEEEGGRKLRARVTAELQPGSNFLSLAAGDDKGIVSRESFFIFRAETGEELAHAQSAPAAKAH